MLVTKRSAVAVLTFFALLVTWAMTYCLACRLGAPRWGLTAIVCIGGPLCGYFAGRRLSSNADNAVKGG